MDPSVYVPAYLEHCYAANHPDLTQAGRALVRDQIEQDPDHFALTPRACTLVSYMRVHQMLMQGMKQLDGAPDEDYEQEHLKVIEQAREQIQAIEQSGSTCVDAQLLHIQLAEISLDECIEQMCALEKRTREHLVQTRKGFDPTHPGLWHTEAIESEASPAELTETDPDVIGWLHTNEAIAQGCIFTARYRMAATYARTVTLASGYPNMTFGTLLLALARLEDEQELFEAAHQCGTQAEDSPWFLLARTILFYKMGSMKRARRALKDFVTQCDGGAFFLLNPTYYEPYLPVRPPVDEAWEYTHMAVWEADGIISDTPDFAQWAESIEGIADLSEDFAQRHGF